MFSGPMFRFERQVSSKKGRPFVVRTVFAIVLAAVGLVIGLFLYSASSSDSTETRLLYFGRALIPATIALELLFLLFFVPNNVAGAIAEEREKDTLPLLLLTRLTSIEIVLTKAFARLLQPANLVLTGLPMLVLGALLAGLEVPAALAFLGLLSCSAFMACLSILASAQREHVATARAQASAWIFMWLLGPPLVTLMPVASGSIWGDLLVELKQLCSLVAPSSPLSLLTDRGWYYRSSALGLEQRVALMIGMQALAGLLAVGYASSRLVAREKHPNQFDPTRGHRPACTDDPILWREYLLPIRHGAGSLFLIRLRYLVIVLRLILTQLLALLSVLLVLVVPVSLFVSTIYYGLAAFRELWQGGSSQGGVFDARLNFNLLIRVATGLLAFFPGLTVASLIVGRITSERDKKTWDAFLTTPLTAEEILRSKALAALRSLWYSAKPLPLIWFLGLVCGVVTPLGVALTAIDLALAAWANIALGLYVGFRPGTVTSATNRTGLGMLAYLVFHIPLLVALLASPREIASFFTLDAGTRWGSILGGLTIMILTGAIAWWLTRRTLDRFDEWAGRPIQPKAKGSVGQDLSIRPGAQDAP